MPQPGDGDRMGRPATRPRRLQEATIEKDGKAITARTAVSRQVGGVFKAAGIAAAQSARACRLTDTPVGTPGVVLTLEIGVVTYCGFVCTVEVGHDD